MYTILLLGIVIVLVLFSGVQTLQLNEIKETFEAKESTVTAGSAQTTTQSQAPRPARQPTMVGGC